MTLTKEMQDTMIIDESWKQEHPPCGLHIGLYIGRNGQRYSIGFQTHHPYLMDGEPSGRWEIMDADSFDEAWNLLNPLKVIIEKGLVDCKMIQTFCIEEGWCLLPEEDDD